MPPDTVSEMSPELEPSLQTIVVPVATGTICPGSNTSALVEKVHIFPSVIVREYVPAGTPICVGPDAPLLQVNIYGGEPPPPARIKEPSVPPLQLTSPVLIVPKIAIGSLTVIV